MWLDGKEAKECGLVQSLRGSESDKAIRDKTYDDDNQASAYRFAARVTKKLHASLRARLEDRKMADTIENAVNATAEPVAAEPAVTAQAEQTEPVANCDPDEPKAEDPIEEPKEPEEDPDAELNALRAENASLKAQIDELKATMAKYKPAASANQAPVAKADWLTLVKELNAKHLPEQVYAKEYSALKAAHKAEFDAFMNSHTIR